MIRTDMISTVGREYLTSNIENDEYSYPKAFAAQSLTFNPIRNKAGRAFEKLDAFNLFPELLTGTNKSAEIISDDIKEIRRTVAHGYAYYYDFKTDSKVKYYILLLDKLIKKMSLKWIGFSESEIKNFSIW